VVELRKLAQKAAAESVFREAGIVTISLRNTDGINIKLLNAARQKSVRIGNKQIKLHIQYAGDGWKRMLKELIGELAVIRHPC
jgi:hypothetical protein